MDASDAAASLLTIFETTDQGGGAAPSSDGPPGARGAATARQELTQQPEHAGAQPARGAPAAASGGSVLHPGYQTQQLLQPQNYAGPAMSAAPQLMSNSGKRTASGQPASDRPAARQTKHEPALQQQPSAAPPAAAAGVRGGDWDSSRPAITLDLRTKDWVLTSGTEWIPWVEHPRSFAHDRLQHMPIKGRNSCKEKEAEKVADILLRSPSWRITNETPFMVIEQLLLMLCKRLNRWTNMEATTWAWCVGGSMVATYASRDATGCASGLSFCLCRRDGWPGGKRSNKVGNTCQTHCVGIRIQNCLVGGVLQPEVEMRKCMWLRCCYGKKPYGSPPAIPWCGSCEYQKKLVQQSTLAGAAPIPASHSDARILESLHAAASAAIENDPGTSMLRPVGVGPSHPGAQSSGTAAVAPAGTATSRPQQLAQPSRQLVQPSRAGLGNLPPTAQQPQPQQPQQPQPQQPQQQPQQQPALSALTAIRNHPSTALPQANGLLNVQPLAMQPWSTQTLSVENVAAEYGLPPPAKRARAELGDAGGFLRAPAMPMGAEYLARRLCSCGQDLEACRGVAGPECGRGPMVLPYPTQLNRIPTEYVQLSGPPPQLASAGQLAAAIGGGTAASRSAQGQLLQQLLPPPQELQQPRQQQPRQQQPPPQQQPQQQHSQLLVLQQEPKQEPTNAPEANGGSR